MGDVMNPAKLPDPLTRYELGPRLGTGVFGQVFQAFDKEANGKKVAVKIQPLVPESEKCIFDEYGILRDFCTSHPNLVDFHGIYCDRSVNDKIWFVMEYCEGGSAIDLVRGMQAADKKLSEEHIAFILKEIIKALTYLHEKNVIHRDVRASNILLTKEGDVKLADFGLSCRLQTNLGKRNTTIGSPSWMAPEVVAGGDANYGNRADVWSLGITAIELADGKAPFQEMHPTRALFQIVRNPPPTLIRPSSWSNDINDFIAECLEKNPEHRPYCMELIEHPFIQMVPDNDYHLTQELKILANDYAEFGKSNRLPERLIKNGMMQTENNPEPEVMHVEDLAALENLSENLIIEELRIKMTTKNSFQTFVGDTLLFLNPNRETDIYGGANHAKYKFKSRSDNEPHVYAVADGVYQDALHHNEPQFIIFTGESYSGKTTNMLHCVNHLSYLGEGCETTGARINKSLNIIKAAVSASTPTNPNSTRCILQVQTTFGRSGKLSGAIFWLYQLEKWRVSSTDMSHGNFNLIYYFYDGIEAEGKLSDYKLESERKHRYLRIPDNTSKLTGARSNVEDNVLKFKQLQQDLEDLEFDTGDMETMWRVLAAILVLGNVRFKDGSNGAAEVENFEEASKVIELLGLDESKFTWALINYCLVERGTAVKRRHSTDEARDARDVLAGTIYRRLVDWLFNSINKKLTFGRSVYGDKYSISLIDMFGFECFHRNRLEQLIVNTMNEQMQFLFNQRMFAWEMLEQEEEQVPVASMRFYDNKMTVDQLMAKPLGLFYILDEACRTSGGQEYIMSTIKNSSKGPYIKLSGSHEFSVAHFTGKINYDARDLADKNRDFLPPEMIETLRASSDPVIKHLFTNKLTRSGGLTAPSNSSKNVTVKREKDTEAPKNRKYNTESRGQYSQMHRMRTAAATFRATSLELLRTLAAAPGAAGVTFVRCIRPTLNNQENGFQSEVVKQQLRALAILDTAKSRQTGYSTRIPFAEFLRRYQFLAFDFDENVDLTKDNCRLLLIRLKMEGWMIGKTKVFLKYYNVEYLARLYETQVKKIVKVQCMMRRFLARRRIEKNKQNKPSSKISSQQSQQQAERNLTEEMAAITIQKAFRGFAVRKNYGPLVNKSTGKLDEETAEFMRKFTTKWRSKSIFQVLLQYRAARYQDLVNFSQQVHIFNQATMQGLITTGTGVLLDRVDPQAKTLEFLGPPQPTVWKLPLNMIELPYFDTTYMCDSSVKCNDTLAVAYDSDPEAWDEPLRRRTHPASNQIRSSIQNSYEVDDQHQNRGHEKTLHSSNASQPLIHMPYSRDPAQPVKPLPSTNPPPPQTAETNFSMSPYNRQGYGNIQSQVWKESEGARPAVYKKKHCAPVKPHLPPSAQKREEWHSPKLKSDLNKNLYGGSVPNDINNPIKELQQLARTKSSEFTGEDEPPFNFQAMLRKTPRNRASMKRTGEAVDLNANVDSPQPEKTPPRPRSCTDFKRKDSVELFKRALKRADSSQNFIDKIANGNISEIVQLAPGIKVEGCVVDL